MMYLYVNEDRSVFKQFCEPLEEDLLCCDDGELSIIKIEENSSYPQRYRNGEWVDIEQQFDA